jgi:hypothetical protein
MDKKTAKKFFGALDFCRLAHEGTAPHEDAPECGTSRK